MIQIELVNYDNLTNLGMQIMEYVNRNLGDKIRVLIDILEIDPCFGLDGFFPKTILRENPKNVGMQFMSYMI